MVNAAQRTDYGYQSKKMPYLQLWDDNRAENLKISHEN
jgi:hypothetical protein